MGKLKIPTSAFQCGITHKTLILVHFRFSFEILENPQEIVSIWYYTRNLTRLRYESFFKIIHPDENEHVRVVVQQAIQSGENLHSEYRIVPPLSLIESEGQGKRSLRGRHNQDGWRFELPRARSSSISDRRSDFLPPTKDPKIPIQLALIPQCLLGFFLPHNALLPIQNHSPL